MPDVSGSFCVAGKTLKSRHCLVHKLTLTETAKQTGQRFIVLAEKGQDDTPRIYQTENISITCL